MKVLANRYIQIFTTEFELHTLRLNASGFSVQSQYSMKE